jgi:hypothetical protein
MSFFKAPDNSIHNIDDDFAYLLPVGCMKISEDEANSILKANAQTPTAEEVKSERAYRLAQSDWTQLPDSPLTAEARSAWAVHRQALRNVTKQSGFPGSVVWPVAP